MSLFSTNTTAAATGTPNTTGDISKDVALNTPPEDSISELAFSPTADFLSVASWYNKVRIYQVNDQGQSEGKAAMDFQLPVLTTAWSLVSGTL
jgi:mRNA export factor